MRSAEFLVFPSEWYETMGRTIMEAFAVGTPVVASSIGPPATMVVPGETGFHFTPGNVAELRERVEWCSQNLDQLRAMRPKARQAFEEQLHRALPMPGCCWQFMKGRVRSGGAALIQGDRH